jgi:hypothetical protein
VGGTDKDGVKVMLSPGLDPELCFFTASEALKEPFSKGYKDQKMRGGTEQ